MRNKIIHILSILILFSCNTNTDDKILAQAIVDKAIEKSGKSKLENAELKFDFRGKTYQSIGKCNSITLQRIHYRKEDSIKDVLNPDGSFERFINDSLVFVADSSAFKYSESINSVHYFVQLPNRLNDAAVEKTYLGTDSINDKVFHNIKVTFKKEGGGTDYQDEYMYWFDEQTYKLDYLAYSFKVNGGGIRFREAYNERIIEGIRFVDYNNYKPKSDTTALKNIFEAFKNKQLELLSKITNSKIKVEKLDEKC
jgi:hypothetical protein